MKFILGQKKQMTQIFKEDGSVVPVTAVEALSNVITQIKTSKKDGYLAVQVGSGVLKKSHSKAQQGHLKGLKLSRWIREFRMKNKDETFEQILVDKYKKGTEFGVEIFRAGDKVRVVGESKGRGFQGVVKRHRFKGSPKTHGTKDQVRMPGSIGATGPAHVFKGTKMGGRMGTDRITVTGLQIVKVDSENNLLYIKGAIPGAYNSLVAISGSGTFKVNNRQVKSKSDSVKLNNEENNEKELINLDQENKEETLNKPEHADKAVELKVSNKEVQKSVKNNSEKNINENDQKVVKKEADNIDKNES